MSTLWGLLAFRWLASFAQASATKLRIAKGDFPKWRVAVQIMPEKEADTYHINPFDLTKVWPHRDYPLVDVGELVLDRNPENYFAEVEQAAFEPKNIVPGMGYSPDKMRGQGVAEGLGLKIEHVMNGELATAGD